MKTLGFLLLIPVASFAQKIENIRAEAEADKIVVTYDLVQGQSGDAYNVFLYSSFNNFRTPLAKVSGDVGQGVREGKGKRIVWEARTEIGNFKGQLTFEIEAILVAPLTLKSPMASTKRGGSIPVSWRGGDQHQNVKIELLKGGTLVTVLGTVQNSGVYAWQVSSKQKPGSDYTLRLVCGNETATSAAFSIKPKIPMWVKIAVPVVIVGVLLIPKSENPATDARLPAPPSILD
jgi:hypothetical protein